MSNPTITCAMCGYIIDPHGQTHCKACPLNQGCSLVCCPACGFETINPAESKLARAAEKVFARFASKKKIKQSTLPVQKESV